MEEHIIKENNKCGMKDVAEIAKLMCNKWNSVRI